MATPPSHPRFAATGSLEKLQRDGNNRSSVKAAANVFGASLKQAAARPPAPSSTSAADSMRAHFAAKVGEATQAQPPRARRPSLDIIKQSTAAVEPHAAPYSTAVKSGAVVVFIKAR